MWKNSEVIPPEYDLTKIKIPVAIINSANDGLSNPFDVEIVSRQLSNLIFRHEMPEKLTSHIDFLFHEPKKLVNTILPTNLIQLYGYPAENHTVVTDDGYIITLHRIPGGKTNKSQNGIPVLLLHGAWICSSTWVDNGEESWGFILADEGYDVWMGNFRDNSYTRQLVDDGTKDEIIGWDKLSVYEVPTIVDYVRNATGFNQILAIGYSMGTTSTFASLSVNEELNNKIKGFVALAPVSNFKYISSVGAKIAIFLIRKFPIIFKPLYKDSILPAKSVRRDFLLRLCPAIGHSSLCKLWFDYGSGYNPNSFNQTRLPIYLLHTVDTFPDRFLCHWAQGSSKMKMTGYDYGKKKNFENYNQATPIEYDLTKIKIPVAIIYSANDVFSSPIDVEIISRQLSNLIYKQLLPGELITHLDFLFHEPKKLINTILPVLSSMWNKN
uniref:Partial AB-hydrolase lipase domain-containing protein n=1 Tax=Strigamia maritima TaxID=126957 RepID=T1JB73_STRMM